MQPKTILTVAIGLALAYQSTSHAAGEAAVAGYTDYEAFRRQVASIAESRFASQRSLGRTLGGREVYLLEIGTGRLHDKPAVLIVGGVHPPHLLGSELAVGVARRLVQRAETDKAARKMLDRCTFYVIPRASPDGCEAMFERPFVERSGNRRPTDDDRDGQLGEDPPEDLNGDGLITMMRVEDPAGRYIPHTDDDRVLIEADRTKGERGRYSLHVEGKDNDGDEAFNEDPSGGVAFNRNFTFDYPYFKPGAGPHQVSEIETRTVADFAFSHPHIAVVLTFTPDDNLMHPWKPDSGAEGKRIKTTLLGDDAPYVDRLAEQYGELIDAEDAPPAAETKGSFSRWAYFHYGRWSLACRGWWIPKVDVEDAGKEDEAVEKAEDTEKKVEDEAEDQKKADKRGADDRNALRWFAGEKIDGFVPWQPVEHPDFPGRRVEVGGFMPFVRRNPPIGMVESLAEKHEQFLRSVVEQLPQLRIGPAKIEPLGGGLWRIRATVTNEGYLPTMSKMGGTTRQLHPVQLELEMPEGVSLVTGHARVQLPTLAGSGGKAEQTWLITAPEGRPIELRLRVWSPSVGSAEKKIQLRK